MEASDINSAAPVADQVESYFQHFAVTSPAEPGYSGVCAQLLYDDELAYRFIDTCFQDAQRRWDLKSALEHVVSRLSHLCDAELLYYIRTVLRDLRREFPDDFTALPTEIHSHVLEYLEDEDRSAFAGTNTHLRGVVKAHEAHEDSVAVLAAQRQIADAAPTILQLGPRILDALKVARSIVGVTVLTERGLEFRRAAIVCSDLQNWYEVLAALLKWLDREPGVPSSVDTFRPSGHFSWKFSHLPRLDALVSCISPCIPDLESAALVGEESAALFDAMAVCFEGITAIRVLAGVR